MLIGAWLLTVFLVLQVLLGSGSGSEPSFHNLSSWEETMRLSEVCMQPLEELLADGLRVVVAMTTIPKRIQRLEPVLDSMLAQTWPLDALYLSIPVKYNRTGELYQIPQWLREKPGVSILRCKDLGPGTHLLNAIKHERDPHAYIVLVDDDHIYAKDLVENLMRAVLCNPGGAVAAQGFLSYPGIQVLRDGHRYLQDNGIAAGPVLVSYLGVVYRRYFFDAEIYDWKSPQCRFQDDMWFSAHLASKGIPRYVLGSSFGVMELHDLHLGPSSLTFWSDNMPRKVNIECNNALLQWKPHLWVWRHRVVLSVSGLPSLDGLPWDESVPQVRTGDWWKALFILRNLPLQLDLTILCAPSSVSGKQEVVLGLPRRVEGMLMMGSGMCTANAEKLRLWAILQSVVELEHDPNTVIVAGTLASLAEHALSLESLVEKAVQAHKTKNSPFAWVKEDVVAFTMGGYMATQM